MCGGLLGEVIEQFVALGVQEEGGVVGEGVAAEGLHRGLDRSQAEQRAQAGADGVAAGAAGAEFGDGVLAAAERAGVPSLLPGVTRVLGQVLQDGSRCLSALVAGYRGALPGVDGEMDEGSTGARPGSPNGRGRTVATAGAGCIGPPTKRLEKPSPSASGPWRRLRPVVGRVSVSGTEHRRDVVVGVAAGVTGLRPGTVVVLQQGVEDLLDPHREVAAGGLAGARAGGHAGCACVLSGAA